MEALTLQNQISFASVCLIIRQFVEGDDNKRKILSMNYSEQKERIADQYGFQLIDLGKIKKSEDVGKF